MPDEKTRTAGDLCLENHRYLAAPDQVLSVDARFANSLGQRLESANLFSGREILDVSAGGQDLTSVIVTQGLGQNHVFTAIENNANSISISDVQAGDARASEESDVKHIKVSNLPHGECETNVSDKAHNMINTGILHRRERIDKALEKPTEQERGSRDKETNLRGVNDQVNENARAVKEAESQRWREAKDEPRADGSNSSQSAISEILKQQGKVLQMSQNGTLNLMEAQVVMSQLSARINQVMAEQRQLHYNWRKLRMEDQNRTEQNMGDY